MNESKRPGAGRIGRAAGMLAAVAAFLGLMGCGVLLDMADSVFGDPDESAASRPEDPYPLRTSGTRGDPGMPIRSQPPSDGEDARPDKQHGSGARPGTPPPFMGDSGDKR